jgi:hypothetical protein
MHTTSQWTCRPFYRCLPSKSSWLHRWPRSVRPNHCGPSSIRSVPHGAVVCPSRPQGGASAAVLNYINWRSRRSAIKLPTQGGRGAWRNRPTHRQKRPMTPSRAMQAPPPERLGAQPTGGHELAQESKEGALSSAANKGSTSSMRKPHPRLPLLSAA